MRTWLSLLSSRQRTAVATCSQFPGLRQYLRTPSSARLQTCKQT